MRKGVADCPSGPRSLWTGSVPLPVCFNLNSSKLFSRKVANKFLPIDDAASNTPQRRANRKRKPTTFSAGDVAVDHVE